MLWQVPLRQMRWGKGSMHYRHKMTLFSFLPSVCVRVFVLFANSFNYYLASRMFYFRNLSIVFSIADMDRDGSLTVLSFHAYSSAITPLWALKAGLVFCISSDGCETDTYCHCISRLGPFSEQYLFLRRCSVSAVILKHKAAPFTEPWTICPLMHNPPSCQPEWKDST